MDPLANIAVASALSVRRLASDEPWIALLKIVWPDDSVVRLARYPQNVTFDCADGAGPQTYLAFAWEFQELEERSDGSIPTWGISISNINRTVEALVETYGGGVGGSVTIFVVPSNRMKREPDLELNFDITGCQSDTKTVRFTLGAASPLRQLLGRHPYTSDSCTWRYKSPQCGYSGTMATCSYTLGGENGCRAHENQLRFGAYPGIDSNGLRVVTR